jgi:hypothetical protein
MATGLNISTKISASTLSTRKPLGDFNFTIDLEQENFSMIRLVLPKNLKNIANEFTNNNSLTGLYSVVKFVHILTTETIDLTFNPSANLNSVFEFSISKHFAASMQGSFKIRNPSLTKTPIINIILA